jgi:acyl-CoA hydrolase
MKEEDLPTALNKYNDKQLQNSGIIRYHHFRTNASFTLTNFSGKIHGGYILSLLDQIAFGACSKFSGNYCVTASVDTVDFF